MSTRSSGAGSGKVSWIVALAVGLVLGVSADRMLGGTGKSAPPAVARPAPPRAAPSAPPVEDPRAVYRVALDDAPVRGPADALVTIVVASDFQCPFCKRVEPTVRALTEAFPGKVRVAWRHQPLPGHPRALPAAIAAEEARAQGGDAKFWSLHDALFESAPALEEADLVRAAEKAGLDGEKVRAALASGKHADRIRRDQALMQGLGANSTPTLFVNGRKVVGAVPLEQLRPVVEEELKKAEALVAGGTPPAQVYARIIEKGVTAPAFLGGGTPGAAPAPAPPQPQAAPPVPPTTAALVPLRQDDPSRGPGEAKLTIALFSDFQCPFCARVEPTIAQMERTWPGQLRVVWKHQPLPFHPNARPAALAAEAAREQGKFWEMHDRMFAGQQQLSASQYEGWAKELGLDLGRFQRSLSAPGGAKRIDEDQALAQKVGADGTPTLFFNCRKVSGAYPFDSFKPVIEEELRKAEALHQSGKRGPELYEAACAQNLKAYPAQAAAAAPEPAPAGLPGGRAAVPLRADDPAKGKATASVTMVLFSDFQCPYCARANPAVSEIASSYPDDVRIVWKHLPLPFHPNALPAALAAEAARLQGGGAKFWAMHDKLFANQQALSEASYERYAGELGLDLPRFRRDLGDPRLRARVEEDAKLAQQLGVNGTPTFIVNGERVVGSGGLKATVDRVLAQAKVK